LLNNDGQMITKTIEEFIRKLAKDGHEKYASELRSVVAMSRRRREAVDSLSRIAPTLLTHLLKSVALPHARDTVKWSREIDSYVTDFNVYNMSPKGSTWLSIAYIQNELNTWLHNPAFINYLQKKLESYSDKDKQQIIDTLKSKKTLHALGIHLSFDSNERLTISKR
jgi:hypothetical protein